MCIPHFSVHMIFMLWTIQPIRHLRAEPPNGQPTSRKSSRQIRFQDGSTSPTEQDTPLCLNTAPPPQVERPRIYGGQVTPSHLSPRSHNELGLLISFSPPSLSLWRLFDPSADIHAPTSSLLLDLNRIRDRPPPSIPSLRSQSLLLLGQLPRLRLSLLLRPLLPLLPLLDRGRTVPVHIRSEQLGQAVLLEFRIEEAVSVAPDYPLEEVRCGDGGCAAGGHEFA